MQKISPISRTNEIIHHLNHYKTEIKHTHPAAQSPDSVPPLARHSEAVKQVPLRNWLPEELKGKTQNWTLQLC